MSKPPDLTLGARVKVTRLRDRVPRAMVDKLRQAPGANHGKVTDFRMTDGSGIGVMVTFPDGGSSWFFNDEVALA